MKAIILAAGQGKRLRPLTQDRPKVMVDVEGQTILDRQIERFRRFGINDITVVTGYCPDSVSSHYSFSRVLNDKYDSTNMAFSLFCAEQQLEGDFIISYGDILYSDDVLQSLLSASHDLSVVVDMEWESYYAERFGDPYIDAESLLFSDQHQLMSIGKGSPSQDEVMAQYIGLIKVAGKGAHQLLKTYVRVKQSDFPIGWGRPFITAYMTDYIQEMINEGIPIYAVPIRRGWYEIDSLTDYELVQRHIREGVIR